MLKHTRSASKYFIATCHGTLCNGPNLLPKWILLLLCSLFFGFMLLLVLYCFQLTRPCANEKQSIWRSPIVLRQYIWQIAISLLWLITMPIITFMRQNDKDSFKNVNMEIKAILHSFFAFPTVVYPMWIIQQGYILIRSFSFDMVVV